MSSGVFRIRETRFDSELMALRKEHIKILFYEDGPDATVSVEQVDGIVAPAELGLRINGKPDAGTLLDLSNQLLLAHLPLLAKPDAKDVFVLGFGSGMTAGAVLALPHRTAGPGRKLRAGHSSRALCSETGIAMCSMTREPTYGAKTRARCSNCARNVTM